MLDGLNRQEIAAEQGAIGQTLPVDREIARTLSAGIGEQNRLAFARSFAFAAVKIWWYERNIGCPLRELPGAVETILLSSDAIRAAEAFGRSLARVEPQEATYLVGTIYTTALPETYRGAHGVYYTPPELVERLLVMAEDAGIDWNTARVLDPACGCGAFLLPLAARMAQALKGTDPAFIVQQIGARLRGFDIDPFGAWLAQVTLEMFLGQRVPQLVETRDSLDLTSSHADSFDLVIGNPPYGRISLSPDRRADFARSVYGHANLYGLFTDAALRWVKKGGVVGYVTPTSMLSGLYYKALRRLLVEQAPPLAINFVHERGGVFTDVLQETMLATYRRDGRPFSGTVGFIEISPTGKVRFQRGSSFVLPRSPESPWLLPRSPEQTALTRRLGAMPHRLADYGYGVSTGPLVWNRFKDQLVGEPTTETFPVIWAESVSSDGRFLWRSEKRNHSPWFVAKRPKDDWLIVKQPCVLLQRTTAKEQPRRLIAAELPVDFIRKHKGVVVENHLNMLRTISSKPVISAAVIAALLNSAAVDAAFRCLNGSVAVSAFELEELPLPSLAVMKKIARLVDDNAPIVKVEAAIAAAYRSPHAAAAA
jgi:adenine-specific DNA-methyltransferase